MDEINSRIEDTEERNSKLKDKTTEITQIKQHTEKRKRED